MTRRPLVVLAVLAALAAPAGGVAACSAGGKGSPASSHASGDSQRALDIGRRFSQCARDHGYPNFPDPVVDGDKLSYPDAGGAGIKEQIATIMKQTPECKAIMDESMDLDHRDSSPPSAADLTKMRRFARCMREHSVPEFPDPKADGTFPIIGTPLEHEGESERVMSAIDVCKQYWDKKIAAS